MLTANELWHLAMAACRALTDYATTAPWSSPMGSIFGTKPTTACGERENSARATTDGECSYLVRFLDDPGPIKLPLFPFHYTASTGGVQGSWRLQLRRGRSVARGTQSNVDESRGADVAT